MAAIGLSIKSLFEVGPSHLAYCARLGLVMTPITLAFLALINEIKSRQRKQAARNKSQTPCHKLLFVPVSTHQTKTESSEIRSREKKPTRSVSDGVCCAPGAIRTGDFDLTRLDRWTGGPSLSGLRNRLPRCTTVTRSFGRRPRRYILAPFTAAVGRDLFCSPPPLN